MKTTITKKNIETGPFIFIFKTHKKRFSVIRYLFFFKLKKNNAIHYFNHKII